MSLGLPAPSILLGLDRFPAWYPGQEEAFSAMMDWYYGSKRFCGLAAPTGTGKTMLALLVARLSRARTVILTSSKGLMEQYLRDAAPLGGVTVKGQGNFPCPLIPGITAEEGPCHEGYPCDFRPVGCPYRSQLNDALRAPIVVSNYAYWLAQTRFSSGLGAVDLLVMDEGHLAFGALESHLTIRLFPYDLEPLGMAFPAPATRGDWGVWQSWASGCLRPVTKQISDLEEEMKGRRTQGMTIPGGLSRAYRSAVSLLRRLKAIAEASGDWVIQRAGSGFIFTPRWVSPYSNTMFQNVPRVLLLSAILTEKTADSLGIPESDRDWIDVPSYFPPENTPIYHVPTIRVNHRTNDYEIGMWVSRIDQIIDRRLDRKGIVFTVSYDRAYLLLQRSRHTNIMISHTTEDVVRVVDRFKRAPAPSVLVSPAVTTGWDFDEETGVRYIIIGKVPWPDIQDPVMQSRLQDDEEWPGFLAMGTLIQEAGRGTRSPTQRTEVLVVDDNITWYIQRYGRYAPRWFLERYRGSLRSVPDPLV